MWRREKGRQGGKPGKWTELASFSDFLDIFPKGHWTPKPRFNQDLRVVFLQRGCLLDHLAPCFAYCMCPNNDSTENACIPGIEMTVQETQPLASPVFKQTKRDEEEREYSKHFYNPFHLQDCVCAQSCLTLCDLMDYSPPGSSVHGILQARILEWAAMHCSRGSARPRMESESLLSPALVGGSLPPAA